MDSRFLYYYVGSGPCDNLIEEEIKERIATGNQAFFPNKKIFQSKLISKKSKIKFYKALKL
jgi:hypothetical protein